MRRFVAGAVLLGAMCLAPTDAAVPAAASAAAAGYTLHGEWQQGALLVGKTDPKATVVFDGRRLRVSPQGYFVFGLDRDAKPDATLSVQQPGRVAKAEHFKVGKRAWEIQRIEGLPPSKVTPPPEAMKRIEREYKLIEAAHSRDTERSDFAEVFQWPIKGTVSGVFGSQRILNGQKKQPHFGVDVAVPTGTPVHAPAGGVVSLAEPDLYFTGGTIILDHGHGLSSIMVHLSKLMVKPGDEVKQGDVVAESGMTGRATGPHLHWGIYWFGAHVDPQSVLAVTAQPQ
jgi:murein DD-endopeptidase MepM/ murein hydrolase activator NlpD